MSLIERLRARLGEPAASFQLQGEDLWLLPVADLAAAGEAYARALREVPPRLRPALEAEHRALHARIHRWLRRYNRDIHQRLAGYAALGRLVHFEYPWPVVAMLGLCTVLDGLGTMRVYNLLGRAAARLGLPLVERVSERLDDVLRRTNRGIFADSTPLVLFALRCHELRAHGEEPLAAALLEGPPPPLFDEQARDLARRLYAALALPDPRERFGTLAALTLDHFGREQAIFTHQLGARPDRTPRPYASAVEARIANPSRVRAPCVVWGLRGRRLTFRDRALPAGFDMRDHAARVELFGELFVRSITTDLLDYQAAVDYALTRFGTPAERYAVTPPPGGAPAPPEADWAALAVG